jgi:hypothetical protein
MFFFAFTTQLYCFFAISHSSSFVHLCLLLHIINYKHYEAFVYLILIRALDSAVLLCRAHMLGKLLSSSISIIFSCVLQRIPGLLRRRNSLLSGCCLAFCFLHTLCYHTLYSSSCVAHCQLLMMTKCATHEL